MHIFATKCFTLTFIYLLSIHTIKSQVELRIENNIQVTFKSAKGYSYNVYGSADLGNRKKWELLGGEEGTGDDITFFYVNNSFQSQLFFKVEEINSSNPDEINIRNFSKSLTDISYYNIHNSTNNISDIVDKEEINGLIKLNLTPKIDDIFIYLPDPYEAKYRQKKIILNIHRKANKIENGKVFLRVEQLDINDDNQRGEGEIFLNPSGNSITDLLIFKESKQDQNIYLELFNDTDLLGENIGKWVILNQINNNANSNLTYRWDKTKLSLRNPDGSWGEFVDLKGKDGTPEISDPNKVKLDLLFANLHGKYSNKIFENTDLTGVVFKNNEDINTDNSFIKNTSFKNSKIYFSTTRNLDGFYNCKFNKADILIELNGEFGAWSGITFHKCDFTGAKLRFNFYDFETSKSKIIEWNQLDRNLDNFERPFFTDSIMPNGDKWND